MNRRQFLGNSSKQLALLNLAAIVPAGVLAGEGKFKFVDDHPVNQDLIQHRILGRTGISVPVVSMGVMNASVPNVVTQAYMKGMRFFDTAWFYQNGRNETMVGEVFEKLGARDKVTICTKVFLKETNRDLYGPEIKQLFLDRFEQSLRRLKTDHTDILLYHAAGESKEFQNPYILEAFNELKLAKKVRYTGVSLHGDDAAMLDDMVKMGYYDVAVVMFNIAMAEDQRLLTAMEKAAQSGIGIIAMKTQCGDGGYMWWNRKNAPQNESKSDLNQTALLKWVLSHPFISTAIPGFTTFEQLEENFSVNLDQKLNEEEMSFLEKNKIQLAQSFCTHCGKCQGTCPNNTNIPDMMRTWMYAFQYRNMEQARLTAGSIQESCKGCETCSAICARGVQIGQRMEALKTAGLQYS